MLSKSFWTHTSAQQDTDIVKRGSTTAIFGIFQKFSDPRLASEQQFRIEIILCHHNWVVYTAAWTLLFHSFGFVVFIFYKHAPISSKHWARLAKATKTTTENIFLSFIEIFNCDDGPRKVLFERQNAKRQKSSMSVVLFLFFNIHMLCPDRVSVSEQTRVVIHDDLQPVVSGSSQGLWEKMYHRQVQSARTSFQINLMHQTGAVKVQISRSFQTPPCKGLLPQYTETVTKSYMPPRRWRIFLLFSLIALRIFWVCRHAFLTT